MRCWCFPQGRVVDIDEAVAKHLHGVRPGINLPLRIDGDIVGVIGLTGEPLALRHYGELVCMTAEMMLEQARLLHMLAQDSRLREELVLNLIRSDTLSPQRLNGLSGSASISINRVWWPFWRWIAVSLASTTRCSELQQLQTLLTTPERDNLIAIVSLNRNGGAETSPEWAWTLRSG